MFRDLDASDCTGANFDFDFDLTFVSNAARSVRTIGDFLRIQSVKLDRRDTRFRPILVALEMACIGFVRLLHCQNFAV